MRADLAMGGNQITGLAPGVNPTDAATVSQVAVSGTGVPVGSIMDYAGATAPTGWLICAGQSILRASYPDLFTAISTTYGSASGTTFNLPDCRGRVTAGLDVNSGGFAARLNASVTPNDQTAGAVGGAQSVTLTEAQIPSHTHVISGTTNAVGDHAHSTPLGSVFGLQTGGSETALDGSFSGSTGMAGGHSHTLTASAANTGGGASHSNVQPTIVFLKVIKALA